MEDDESYIPPEFKSKYSMTNYVLGHGTFAVVRVCEENETGVQRAVKIVARRPLQSDHDGNEMDVRPGRIARDEIEIMMRVQHPNVIRLWDFYETDEGMFLVMDLCPGGELFDNIVKRTTFKEYDAQCIMRQLLLGVEYLHSNGIVHRDLKPENILMYDEDDIYKGIVISDFGLAKLMPEEGLLLTACGSPQYVAPEVLLGQGYDENVDVWSCGVIAYALLCGYTPFNSESVQHMFQNIVQIEYEFHPAFWPTQSMLAKDFIDRCLCEKNQRMTVHDALQHPWMTHFLQLSPGKEESPILRRVSPAEYNNPLSRCESLTSQLNDLAVLQRLRKRYFTVSDHELVCVEKFVKRFKAQLEMKKDTAPIRTSLNSKTWCVTTESLNKKDCQNAERSKSIPVNDGNFTRHYIRESSDQAQQVAHTTNTIQVLNKLLEQYRTAKLPAYSRVDPKAEMRPQEGMSISKAIRTVPAILNRSYSIGSAIVSHLMYGPPKKSWGVEMSILTRMIREIAEENTDLASISGLQQLFELMRFFPIPDDGLVTPVTFRVKRRNLKGFLSESDSKETGKRELTGEWIVGKQTWRRLQNEWQTGNRRRSERVILYVHGGAYFVMSATTHRPLTIAISKYCECRVFCVNYRLAPDTIFPGALLDVANAYFRLTDDLHIPPNNVVVAADSAGGGLALALMMYLRDNQYPLPCGAILMSPWVDLTLSCDSWETNKDFDYLPRPGRGNHMNPINAYLGPNIDMYLMHPYVSPLFGEMNGLPPMLIQTGDAERLRDENVLFAHKCALAGVPIRSEIYEDCVHVFQFFLFLEASRKAFQSMRHFMRTVLDKRPKRQASVVEEDTREQLDQEMTGAGAEQLIVPGSPQASQRPAEDCEPDGSHHQTLKGLGPEGDEDTETWELDGEEDTQAKDQLHSNP